MKKIIFVLCCCVLILTGCTGNQISIPDEEHDSEILKQQNAQLMEEIETYKTRIEELEVEVDNLKDERDSYIDGYEECICKYENQCSFPQITP